MRDSRFNSRFDDPALPPPGRRTGLGIASIVPFLKRSLAIKAQVAPQPEDVPTVPLMDLPPHLRDRYAPGKPAAGKRQP